MAGLTGITIADSYDQLIISNNSSGGNGAGLITLQDGDGGTTFCVSMNDASTGKSTLSIDGSHANGTALLIDNSAGDGDVSVEWQLGGTTTWLMGIEDGDSDSLKICHDSTMGTDERLSFLTASTVINEDSADIDFRVEGATDINLLFCDASADTVGIGTSGPNKTLSVVFTGTDTTVASGNNLNGGGAGDGLLIVNSADDVTNTYANLDFRCHSADGRIAYVYTGTDNVGDFHFITDNAGVSTKMVIKANGNVGIGTLTPGELFEVSKSGGQGKIAIASYGDSATNQSELVFKKADNTEASPQLIENDDVIGQIKFQGYTNGFVTGAVIEAKCGPTPASGSDLPTEINFYTAADGAVADVSATPDMTINPSGYVGIGVNPTYPLTVTGTGAGGFVALFDNSAATDTSHGIQIQAGDVGHGDSATHYIEFVESDNDVIGQLDSDSGDLGLTDTSDERLKKDIVDTATKGLEIVNGTRMVDFKWKKNDLPIECGIIAQELQKVFPRAVKEGYDENKTLGIRKTNFIYVLIKAVQELSAKVTALENA